MQTRYMERSNSMAREKRALESGSVADGDDDGQPERKRPALASVIVEALKVDSLQRLCSSLEPILRRVVSEEVERALAKLGPAKVAGRSSPKMIEGLDGRNLQLRFRTRLSLPLFTGGKVEGEQGAAVHIALFDANSGQVVTSGPESSVKLDVVVLEGDFSNEDDNWTAEEFESHVVKEREGKRPLLTGDVQMTLKEGIGTLGEFTFTDNSSWVRSRKFRLGLKVASGHCEGVRIREAKTEAFTVKDHRGELYKKHYPPALNDEVWRLEKIGKDGSFHKRLNKAEIYTVEDFLRYVVKDSQRLRNILGSGMSNKMWDALIEHAKTCVLSGKLYLYYPDGAGGVGVVFNNICEFSGLIASGQYCAADALSDNQKICADTWVKKAYDNWLHVEEYDAKSLLRLKKNKVGDVSNSGSIISPQNPNSFSNQLSLPSAPVSAAMMQPSMDSSRKFEGYNGNVVGKYSIQAQNMSFNGSVQFNCSSVAQNQLIGTSDQTQFSRNKDSSSLGPSQSSLNIFQPIATPNLSSYRGIEDMLTEEEIRMRSLEMLEHEDMQHHLLRLFNMDGNDHAPVGRVEDEYTYSADYAPPPSISYGFEEVRTRSSGKAVVGWLKLKAALRWGIFVRKRAAERRAHVVELDDT